MYFYKTEMCRPALICVLLVRKYRLLTSKPPTQTLFGLVTQSCQPKERLRRRLLPPSCQQSHVTLTVTLGLTTCFAFFPTDFRGRETARSLGANKFICPQLPHIRIFETIKFKMTAGSILRGTRKIFFGQMS